MRPFSASPDLQYVLATWNQLQGTLCTEDPWRKCTPLCGAKGCGL